MIEKYAIKFAFWLRGKAEKYLNRKADERWVPHSEDHNDQYCDHCGIYCVYCGSTVRMP